MLEIKETSLCGVKKNPMVLEDGRFSKFSLRMGSCTLKKYHSMKEDYFDAASIFKRHRQEIHFSI